MIDDKTLVAELQNKSTLDRAFRVLMTEYKQRLYWHIRKIVVIHEDADDVLQNTFIKVYRNINSFKGESKLYSWLYRIATNESITLINKRAKHQQIESEELQQQLVNNLQADVYFEGDEIQWKLQKAIAQLPQKQQLVFNMKYFDNMKYQDISEILETSVGGLKANYHHAVKKIEKYLTSN
ncbi:MAG TPA: sigma-70 family RNA polymerase sigma factor [Lutibacter sp.]|nr:sigma-70 family RNA polymerase sigma factor [Lutibacter sp.]